MVRVRPFPGDDWPVIWPLLRATFGAGDTCTFAPDIGEAEARRAWVELPAQGQGVVGRLPGAFLHQRLGYVDAPVMFKQWVPADVVYHPAP
jgi:hypothetical protein